MTIQFLYLTAQERVDLSDLQYAALDSQLGALQALPQAMLTSPQKQQAWIMQGFAVSSPTGQVLTVGVGSALLSLRQGAQVAPGMMFTAADPVSVDLTNYSAATYSVYVRFVLAPTALDTRTFWQAGGTGQEYAATVPTRYTGDIEVAVSQTLPGAEYLQIAAVTVPSMAFTDMRPLYFEGRVDQATASGWGGGNDRSDNRATYGVGDLQTALSAVRQSLEDIKGSGLARWYSAFVAGQTIGYAGQAVLGQTSWLDANFYMQGSATRPTLNWAADGAHLAYVRAAGLMAATGPAIGAPAGSLSTAFAFRSGVDEVLVQASFYRYNASEGGRGIDAFLTRGTPGGSSVGGVGFYDDQGIMGAAGVGLGFAFGSAPPTLFVNNFVTMVGGASAANIVEDGNQVLQVPTLNGNLRYLSFTDGSQSLLALGVNNNYQGSGAATGVLTLNDASFVVSQAGATVASINNTVWQFGQGAGSAPYSSVSDGAVNIVNSPGRFGVATPCLWINNQNTPPLGQAPYDAQVALGVNKTVYYRLFAGSTNFSVLDALNNVNVLAYSNTTKTTTLPSALNASNYVATSSSTSAYGYSPAVSYTNTLSGIQGKVMLGTGQQGTLLSYLGIASSGTAAIVNMAIPAMQGSQIVNFSAELQVQSSQTITLNAYWVRTDMINRTDNAVGNTVTVTSSPGANTRLVTLGGPLNLETSNPYQCWTLSLQGTSSSDSFSMELHYVAVTLSTPALNPQRQ